MSTKNKTITISSLKRENKKLKEEFNKVFQKNVELMIDLTNKSQEIWNLNYKNHSLEKKVIKLETTLNNIIAVIQYGAVPSKFAISQQEFDIKKILGGKEDGNN